jgi:hypothetical protein
MLQTYKAILRGNRLEWRDSPPAAIPEDRPVAVHVTILDDAAPVDTPPNPGQQLAALLEQLAQIHALVDIADPVTWERDVRSDRPLLDRED